MPGQFTFAIVLAILAIITFAITIPLYRISSKQSAGYNAQREAAKRRSSESYDETRLKEPTFTNPIRWPISIGVVLLVLAIVLTTLASFTTVPTKEFGIVTAFGKPVGALTNGLHAKAPWNNVTTIDAAIQTDPYKQGNPDKNFECITVRIAHQATACVDTTVSWRIKDGAADALFQNYRDFSNIRFNLVTRQLNAKLNNAFEGYDPLAIDDSGNATAPELSTLASQVTQSLQSTIGDQIDSINVTIPVVHYDDNTTQKVNALLGQVAQTRIAAQQIVTNEKQAEANAKLAASLSNDPNVLVNKCLDIVEGGKVTLPAGFTCWPGGSSAVVVPSSGPAPSTTPAAK